MPLKHYLKEKLSLLFSIIIVVALFIPTNQTTAQTISDNSELYDSTRISPDIFYFANNQRYTLTGKLPYKETNLQILPASLFAGFFATFLVSQHLYQVNTIWTDQTKFRFIEDGNYSLGVDKYGHFYGAYLTSQYIQEGLYISGIGYETSAIASSLIGLGYSTYIEIMDGYGKNWGFSFSDFYADIAGSAFFIAQHYFPVLQNVTPKFSYIPANWYGEFPREEAVMFNDDYSSQTFWYSLNVYNILPKDLKKYWVPWLEIAVGYTTHGLHDNPSEINDYAIGKSWKVDGSTWGSRKVILALDYNLNSLLPDDGQFWNWLKQNLNYFKLPSPAIEYGLDSKEVHYYLVYPFAF